MDDEYQSIGIGLYLQASVFDHSCNPNSVIIFNGKGNSNESIEYYFSFGFIIENQQISKVEFE